MLPPQPRQFLLQRFDARPRLGAQLLEPTREVLLLLENDSFERIDLIGKSRAVDDGERLHTQATQALRSR